MVSIQRLDRLIDALIILPGAQTVQNAARKHGRHKQAEILAGERRFVVRSCGFAAERLFGLKADFRAAS